MRPIALSDSKTNNKNVSKQLTPIAPYIYHDDSPLRSRLPLIFLSFADVMSAIFECIPAGDPLACTTAIRTQETRCIAMVTDQQWLRAEGADFASNCITGCKPDAVRYLTASGSQHVCMFKIKSTLCRLSVVQTKGLDLCNIVKTSLSNMNIINGLFNSLAPRIYSCWLNVQFSNKTNDWHLEHMFLHVEPHKVVCDNSNSYR